MRILPILAALAFAASACSRTVPTATVPAIGSASPAPSAAEPSTTAVATATATAGTPTPTPPPTPVPPPETYPLPCGEADPTCLSLAVKTQRGINYTGPVACGQDGATCLMQLDTFAPPATKRLPVVVMIPGGPVAPGIRDSMWNLARLVAARGAVVFAADYRSGPQWGGGYPQTFGDVACAIRFARQHAPELGGDPARVTLVAHSFGGFPASVTALSRHDFATDEPECLTTTGDGRPNALVGVAAIYGFDHIGQDFLAQMLGGMRDEVPDAWAAADITVLAAAKHHPTPPVRLLAGTADLVAPIATADEFATLLRDAGIDVTVTAVDGADHGSILAKPVTVDTIAALIGASGF
jgi:acetyl esterase/lipase